MNKNPTILWVACTSFNLLVFATSGSSESLQQYAVVEAVNHCICLRSEVFSVNNIVNAGVKHNQTNKNAEL